MLRNMKVRSRLLLLIGLSIFFMALLSFVALRQMNSIMFDMGGVTNNTVPSLSAISAIRGSMNQVAIYETRHILNQNKMTREQIERDLAEKKADVARRLDEYENGSATQGSLLLPEENEVFQSVKVAWTSYINIHEQVLERSRGGQADAAETLSAGLSAEVFNIAAANVSQWADEKMSFASLSGGQALQTVRHASNVMIAIPIGAAVLALILGMIITSSISRPINHLARVSQAIAGGRLDQRADENASELGQMAHSFNQMADNLRERLTNEQKQRLHLQQTIEMYVAGLAEVARGNLSQRVAVRMNGGGADDPLVALGNNLNEMTADLQRTIGQIRDAASDLNAASTEILAATTQQASGASEQSAAITQAATTVEEVKTIATHASQRAQEMAAAAQRTVSVSMNGQKAVLDTIDSMGQIKTSVSGIAENILTLSEQTQRIGEIITTVSDIAAQSNMLALNASVEAARAGEHGRGFAVVAGEVRSLAEQSRQATNQVKAILSEIQRATNATVMATEEGAKGVDKGVQLANQARDAISSLSQVISETTQTTMQMASGSEQQVSGIDQMAFAMQSINQATIQSLASTRQAEKAAQHLSDLSRHLMETFNQYQI
jgi:methyl-accepting chemotaxis protein